MTELNFKGKEFVYNHHLSVPLRPLEIHKRKGIGPTALDGNLIIHGDNLHALKSLLPMYAGKIDCVYIDPPYNTGNEGWAYNDNVNSPVIREWLLANPIGIEDGLRHDKWCAMMWPRLRLLKELLSPDGLLFISINDIENARLVQMIGEIFGEDKLLGQFIWKSRQNKDNRNVTGLSTDHEFILIVGSELKGAARLAAGFDNPDNDSRGPWNSGNMVGMASREDRPNLHFDLFDPETNINYGCPPRGWRYEPSTMRRLIAEQRILWPASPDGRPREKVFSEEMSSHTNVSSVIALPVFTRNGTEAYERIMGNREFAFPKPPELLRFLINQHPSSSAIVLDSFIGSGTTAQAVLECNAHDGGNRRFIGIEMEDYADRLTAERIRRIIRGYSFSGTVRTELLRESFTYRTLHRAGELIHKIDGIENLEAHRFDRIRKEFKDGEIIVTGEKSVSETAEGLGGSFTFCSLGEPVELDRILNGEALPNFVALGGALFYMATNRALNVEKLVEADFYLGETESQHVWLFYRADLDWLKSPEAALTLKKAKQLASFKPGKKHLVFAPSRFVSQKLLAEQNIPVEFVPLPFALYRIETA